MNDRIGIFFGGVSDEYEISLMSAGTVLRAIDRNQHEVVMIGITREGAFVHFTGDVSEIEQDTWQTHGEEIRVSDLGDMIDFGFPVIHGRYGEDGSIQGLLQILQIPYAGCGIMSSALNLDKVASKQVFEAAGLPVCGYEVTDRREIAEDTDGVVRRCERLGGYPLFVKPANTGSSIGISRVEGPEELPEALERAAVIDRRVIIEQGIHCRELEVGVIGNEEPRVSGAGEITSGNVFYDYEAKYTDGVGTNIYIPAPLTDEELAEVRELGRSAYIAADCQGFARVDMMKDLDTGKVYVNEINTIPGFTKYSMFPLLWKEAGVSLPQQIERIIALGYACRKKK